MNSNLYALFRARFPKNLDDCWLETEDAQYYSWRDLERGSAKIAGLLASLNLPEGSRVAVQVEKSPEALMLYLATLRAGLVYLPLNTAYRTDEMAYFISDATPAVVVCAPKNFGWIAQIAFRSGTQHLFTLDQAHQGRNSGTLLSRAVHFADTFPIVHSAPNDLAAILYTSGTTGRSKGAMLSHGNLASNVATLHELWQWQHDDVLLHALPLFHIHGLFVAFHGALWSGSKTLLLNKFDSAAVGKYLPRASVFMGVPTFYVRLLSEPSVLPSACTRMRLFIAGSAPLLTETFHQFAKKTGHHILERYGMSETGMLSSNPYAGLRKPGTVGQALPEVHLRLIDASGLPCATGAIGEIQVKGPNVFQGYWQMPEKTAEEFTADGYFKTGDLGCFDTEGYLSIVGRCKDLIISGGYNIYPKEIESCIDALPGVLESAVIGVPHADFGEAVVAVVVAKEPAGSSASGLAAGLSSDQSGGLSDGLSAEQIIAALKEKIAHFKVPKQVHFVDALPRNSMGKVQKNSLREQFLN